VPKIIFISSALPYINSGSVLHKNLLLTINMGRYKKGTVVTLHINKAYET
jgi:hypothetical protein